MPRKKIQKQPATDELKRKDLIQTEWFRKTRNDLPTLDPDRQKPMNPLLRLDSQRRGSGKDLPESEDPGNNE
jgi:hypothetical protein